MKGTMIRNETDTDAIISGERRRGSQRLSCIQVAG